MTRAGSSYSLRSRGGMTVVNRRDKDKDVEVQRIQDVQGTGRVGRTGIYGDGSETRVQDNETVGRLVIVRRGRGVRRADIAGAGEVDGLPRGVRLLVRVQTESQKRTVHGEED